MADMQPNQQPWENQWQNAFKGAETPPPVHVWKNIEGELAVQESGKYRRGFLLYRAVAAILLLLIAGLTWYIVAQQPTTSAPGVADRGNSQKRPEQPARVSPTPLTIPSAGGSRASGVPWAESETTAKSSSGDAHQSGPVAGSSSSPSGTVDAATATVTVTESRSEATDKDPRSSFAGSRDESTSDNLAQMASEPSGAAEQGQPAARSSVATVASVASRTVAEASPLQLPAQSETTLYRVPQIPTTSAEKDRPSLSFFAGLSLAPGYFDPQFQANAGDFGAVALSPSPGLVRNAANFTSPENYPTSALPASIGVENTPELSFSYGFNAGMRLSDHWVLESGVDYNRFSTSTATRWVVADVTSGQRFAYVATNANTLDNNLNQAPNTSTALNNAYEFIAVPMKIGYRRSVSKFQFTVSSGVAANFFLRNAISASSAASELSTYRISASQSGSPFNEVYYSGLLSGGVNYNVLGRYFLSLTPTYTFALTPLTRVDSNLTSNPYSFGLNVGFQYQF